MPGVRVAIELNGPPFSWPGFMSNVSVWLGPPFIHSRMQDRFGFPDRALAAASRPNQPHDRPSDATAEADMNERRETVVMKFWRSICRSLGDSATRSIVPTEFSRVQQHPKNV